MQDSTAIQRVKPFESASELRDKHIGLLEELNRQLVQEATAKKEAAALAQLEPQIREFLDRGVATGIYLEEIEERTACQVLLDYWVSSMSRAGIRVSGVRLAEFDGEQLPVLSEDDCPYVGLKAFTDETYFYGREANSRELLEMVKDHPLVVVHGASGSGKSSLVMGGVLPMLKAKGATSELLIVPSFTPGNAVLDNLVKAVLQVCQSTCGSAPEEVSRLRQDFTHLYAMVGGENAPPTLITIDQFEEVFTLSAPVDREALATNLVEFLKVNRGHRVILTLREEFKNRIVELRALSPYLVDKPAWYSMRPMTYEELKSAVEEPAKKVNLQFQPGIVDELVKKMLGQDAALPLLQFTLRSLWKKRKRNRITREVYNAVGDPLKTLEKSADDFFEGQIPENQAEIKRILLDLVRVDELLEAYRQPVLKSSLLGAGQANTEEVLKLLAEKDYVHITPSTSDASTVVEVKHESLIRNWPKFVSWIDEKRRKIRERIALTQAAKRWAEKGKQQKGLLTRSQLEDVKDESDLSELEKEFIQASTEAVDRRQREREADLRRELEEHAQTEQKLRDRLLAVVILGVFALLAALIAGHYWRVAEKQTQIATQKARIATTRQLAAQSQVLAAQSQATLEKYPQRSLLLAVEAVATTVRAEEPRVPAAETALRQALSSAGGQALSGHEECITAVAFSPDRHWLVTGSEDKTARLWDLEAPATEPKILLGHKSGITAVAISPDSHWLVTGSWDKTACLWDLKDPTAPPIVLEGHKDGIAAVAISSDSRWLVTGSRDETACLWDLEAPATEPKVLHGHKGSIITVAISPDSRWLVTGTWNKTACLWDLKDPTAPPIVLEGHKGSITAVAISPDKHWLVTGSWDQTACLWDLTARARDQVARPQVLRGHKGGITAVAISPDSHWLVTGSRDKTARLWYLTAKGVSAESRVLRGHKDIITAVAISPDSRWLATGSGDNTARLWDLTATDEVARPKVLRGHDNSIDTVAISPDSRWLVTGSGDKTARLWDLKDPAVEPKILYGHKASITAVAISPEKHWLVTGSSDETACLYDLTTKGVDAGPKVLGGHMGSITAVAISPDSHWLVTGSVDKTAQLWDLTARDQGARPKVLRGHDNSIDTVAISPDSRWLVTGSGDKTARLWDLKDPAAEPRVLNGHKASITAVAFSPDKHWLVTGSGDSTARLWDLKDPAAEPRVLNGHKASITAVAFSPDKHWLVTGSWDKTACLWDLKDPVVPPIVLQGHEGGIKAVAVSPDGRWLVTGSGDMTARLWDLTVRDQIAGPKVLRGHDSSIEAVAISPDSRWLVTGSWDKTARLWDLKDPVAPPIVLEGHEGGITAVAISPDGRWLVTGSGDMTARLWNLDLDELVGLACRTAARNLTDYEWGQYIGDKPCHKTCLDFSGCGK